MKLPPGYLASALDETALKARHEAMAQMQQQTSEWQKKVPERNVFGMTISREMTSTELAALPNTCAPGVTFSFVGNDFRLLAGISRVKRKESGWETVEPDEETDLRLISLYRTDGTAWPEAGKQSLTEMKDVPSDFDCANLPDEFWVFFAQGLMQTTLGKQLHAEILTARDAMKWEL